MKTIEPGRCFVPEQVAAFLEGRLPPDECDWMVRHADECDACERALASGGPAVPGLDRWREQAAVETGAARRTGRSPILFPGPPTPDAPLGRVGPYHVRRELGRGTFGAVYEARDENLRRPVALKVLLPEWAVEESVRSRFLSEARALAAVRHDHIVAVYAVEAAPGFPLPYLVMELVQGESLEDRLEREGVLSPRSAAELARQAALGLDAAHRHGLIHRDVKPGNVLVEAATGRAKVADFGLARPVAGGTRWTQAGETPGTPAYMSPEQILGRPLDARCDIYALGVVLYEMLTGARPFAGAMHLLLEQAVRDDPPPPRRLNPAVPRDLETVCLKCLEKEPANRYASAQALADDLARFLEGRPVAARRPSVLERAAKWSRRNPATAALMAAVALCLSLAGAALVAYADRAAMQRERDEAARLRGVAEIKEEEAARQWFRADRLNYIAHMRSAHKAFQLGDFAEMRDWLEAQANAEKHHDFEWRYLRRLDRPEVRALPRRGQRVNDVDFGPGRLLASAYDDGTVRLWDYTNIKEIAIMPADSTCVNRVRFSPDGRMLATVGAGGEVVLWDIPSGKRIRTLAGARATDAAFGPSKSGLIASSHGDGCVRVWDAATGRLEGNLPPQEHAVEGVAFSPDGRRIATAGHVLREWDWPGGKQRPIPDWPTSNVRVAYSPDGRLIGPARCDRLLDARDGKERKFDKAFGDSFAFAPDGRYFATEDGDTATIRDTVEGKTVRSFRHGSRVRCVAFGLDGQLATGADDGTVKVWDGWTEPEDRELAGDSLSPCLAFSLDGTTLACAGPPLTRTARILDPVTEADLATLEGHGDRDSSNGVECVAFGRGGRLATGAFGEPRIWRWPGGGEPLILPGRPNKLRSLAFSPDGRTLATAAANQPVRLWDADTGAPRPAVPDSWRDAYSVAFGGRVLAVAVGKRVLLREMGTASEGLALAGHSDQVRGVAVSPDGTMVASASEDKTVRLWSAGSGEPLHVATGHGEAVFAVAFSPDGKRLASVDESKLILWDTLTGQEVLRLKWRLAPSGTTIAPAVAFSPDGDRLAVQTGQEVKVWDAVRDDVFRRRRLWPMHRQLAEWYVGQKSWFAASFYLSRLRAGGEPALLAAGLTRDGLRDLERRAEAGLGAHP